MDADGTELECRVCRSGAEIGRPLFFPCMCSGSIGAVHQDCLEAWLEHSKKDTCELCYTKYEFRPHYAEGTPSVLPINVMAKSVLRLAFEQVAPLVLRIVFAVLVWAIIVPVLTTCIYCVCVGRSSILSLPFSWPMLKAHIVHGINTDAMIALSLLILVSHVEATTYLRIYVLIPLCSHMCVGIVHRLLAISSGAHTA
jgi:E3 ubiquitin-protein ligase DOA10